MNWSSGGKETLVGNERRDNGVSQLGLRIVREDSFFNPSWKQDYIHRGSTLHSGSLASGGIIQYHLDHLGTPRYITNASRGQYGRHAYYPFGEESTAQSQNTEEAKFTGHERDTNFQNLDRSYLDYMHARYYSPVMGRFLSVDPFQTAAAFRTPQLWNRYAYVGGNPVNYTDPTGMWRSWRPSVEPGERSLYAEGITVLGVPLIPDWGEAYELARKFRHEFDNLQHLSISDFSNTPEEIASATDYGRCVQENRLDPLWALAVAGSAMPKAMLPPFRNVYSDQRLTNLSSVAAHYLGETAPRTAQALRGGGRAVSRVATPVTLAEGLHAWIVLIGCASN
jgi:RHS repeat-associated protein